MGRSHVKVTKNQFARFTQDVRDRLDDITEMYAGMIEASAAVAAPYEFGILQESIGVADVGVGMPTWSPGGGTNDAIAGAGRVSSGRMRAARRIVVGAYYGLFQHEGTSRGIDPNPFLADAVEHWRGDYLRAVAMAVRGG